MCSSIRFYHSHVWFISGIWPLTIGLSFRGRIYLGIPTTSRDRFGYLWSLDRLAECEGLSISFFTFILACPMTSISKEKKILATLFHFFNLLMRWDIWHATFMTALKFYGWNNWFCGRLSGTATRNSFCISFVSHVQYSFHDTWITYQVRCSAHRVAWFNSQNKDLLEISINLSKWKLFLWIFT